GLDGVMAKDPAGTYEPNKRVMLKVKHERDCDCVVAGFRWHKKGEHTMVGSLLLGLFDDAGALQHVGVCASFSTAKRKELVEFLQPYRKDALMNHPWKAWADYATENDEGVKRMPGGQSRWSQGKDLSWEPLRPELIVEVAYDHMQGSRFRHTAQFRRWRTDKKPSESTVPAASFAIQSGYHSDASPWPAHAARARSRFWPIGTTFSRRMEPRSSLLSTPCHPSYITG